MGTCRQEAFQTLNKISLCSDEEHRRLQCNILLPSELKTFWILEHHIVMVTDCWVRSATSVSLMWEMFPREAPSAQELPHGV